METISGWWRRLKGNTRAAQVARLERMMRDGLQVLALRETPAWKTYIQRRRSEVARWIDELLALPVAEFSSARGIELRAKIVSARAMITADESAVAEGIAAEDQLKRMGVKPAPSE